MQKGQLIAGRFELEAKAASGGMGNIFRALDLATGLPVALKTWPGQFALGEASADRSKTRSLRRFEREASALAAITHPAVVRYVAHGVTESAQPFLVMSWVAGCDLADKLANTGLSVTDTLLLAERVLSALTALHARGVVHRDLKPANIMLEAAQAREAVLVDFGIARDAKAVVLTGRGAQLGTPCYMSPEQIRDPRTVDGRADVFALGCIMFECLAGTRAFAGDDVLATVAQVLLDGPPDLGRLRPDLPASIVRWVTDLLATDRERRPFADAALAERLSRLLRESDGWQLGPPNRRCDAPLTVLTGGARETIEAAVETRSSDALREGISPSAGKRGLDLDEPSQPLIARELELAQLRELLGKEPALIALWGPPGIGKTRLAREFWRASLLPSDGSLCPWVDLSSATDRAAALRLLSVAIGARISGVETAAVAVGRALAATSGAIAVLDGADALLPELAAIVVQARRFAPRLTVIVTSRARPTIPEAVTLELGPLATLEPDSEANFGAAPSPSAQLFLLHAALAGARFPLDAPPLTDVERIVRELEGIPLAIELAAARVPSLGVAGVLALCGRTGEGPGAELSRPPLQRSALHDALRSAWNSLTPLEQRLLAASAVFRGSFCDESAARVAALDCAPRPVLQALREKSMLRAGSAGFSMFSVVREFALAEWSARGELRDMRIRHASWAGQRAAALQPLSGERELEFTRRVEAESDDLIAAVECALSPATRDLPLALSILRALEPVIVARGPLPAFLELFDRAIAAAEPAIGRAWSAPLSRVLVLRARLRATSGRFRDANSDLDASEQLEDATSNPGLMGSVCLERGLIHHFQHDLPSARREYQRAISLLRPTADLRSLARCYGNLGAVFHDDGKLVEAAAYYWKAIQALDELGEARLLANFLGNLALLEQELGALPSARRRYERAVALLQSLGDARLRAIMIGNLGSLEAELGDWQTARDHYELALALLRPLEDARSLALCLARLSAAQAMLGRLEAASEEFAQAQRLASAGDPLLREAVGIFQAFLELGRVQAARRAGDRGAAQDHLQRAEAICRRAQRQRSDGRSLSRLSDDIRTALRSITPRLRDLRAASDAGSSGA